MDNKFIDQLLHDPVTVIDAGGRGGFDLLTGLDRHIILHSFEPDSVSFDELVRIHSSSRFRKAEAYPIALSDKKSIEEFYSTVHPSMSSLLEPDPERFFESFNAVKHNEKWVARMKVQQRTKVETETLSSFLLRKNINAVDLLKLDTQGSELKILRGVEHELRKKNIGLIFVEVLFIPNYKAQPVFSDIDIFLREMGYRFIDLRVYPDAVNKQNSTDFSGNMVEDPKIAIGGDAVYIPEFSENDDPRKVKRAALLLTNLGYYSDSKHLLKTFCGMSAQNAEVFQKKCAGRKRKRFRKFVQRWTPPAVQNIYSRMKK